MVALYGQNKHCPQETTFWLLWAIIVVFFEIGITKTTTAEKIIELRWNMFVTHGLPLSLQTDNGPQYFAEQFCDFFKVEWY